MSDYTNLIKRLRDYSNARKGEIAELTGEAADALERRKGKWSCERVDFGLMVAPWAYVIRYPTCSVCGYHAMQVTNYCPKCGADTRKDGEA